MFAPFKNFFSLVKRPLKREIDDGARPDVKSRPDLMALLAKLQSDLDDYGGGWFPAPAPAPPPPPPPAE